MHINVLTQPYHPDRKPSAVLTLVHTHAHYGNCLYVRTHACMHASTCTRSHIDTHTYARIRTCTHINVSKPSDSQIPRFQLTFLMYLYIFVHFIAAVYPHIHIISRSLVDCQFIRRFKNTPNTCTHTHIHVHEHTLTYLFIQTWFQGTVTCWCTYHTYKYTDKYRPYMHIYFHIQHEEPTASWRMHIHTNTHTDTHMCMRACTR